MNRRDVLRTSVKSLSVLALAPAFKPLLARAQEVKESVIAIAHEITNNHGHAVTMDLVQALSLLRASTDGQIQVVSIQGQSGHPHTLEMNHEELLQLFVTGILEKRSSEDFGHSHGVRIQMDINTQEL